MKKVLAVLAVLAVAAAAQAELLASWGADGVANLGNGYKEGNYTYGDFNNPNAGVMGVTDLSYYGKAVSTAKATDDLWNMKSLNAEGSGLSFGYTVIDGWEVAGASISGVSRVSNAGPGEMGWFVGTTSGDPISKIEHNNSNATEFDSSLGTLKGTDTVYLLAIQSAGRATATTAIDAGGTFAFRTSATYDAVELTGNPQESAVPEPATMSLLGLGALAMALRRKLRK